MSVAAIGALTALVTLATALTTLLVGFRNKAHLNNIQVSVDGQMSALIARVDQLTIALEGSDTDVPDLPPKEKPPREHPQA